MNHRQAIELLADHGAGRCGGRQLEQLELHLAGCAECRNWVETYRELSREVAREDGAKPALHADSADLALYAVDAEELSAESRQKILRHLSDCPECRSELEATNMALSRVRQAGRSRVGQPLAGIRATFESPRRLAIAAAVLVGLLVGAFFVARRSDSPVAERTSQRTTLTGERLVEAEVSMVVADLQIDSGSAVVFRAGEMVALDNGFVVDGDASFSVDVADKRSGRRRRDQPGEVTKPREPR